jgi:hypothetical protein
VGFTYIVIVDSIFTWSQLETKIMNTFILEIRSLDYHILPQLNKGIICMSPITLGDL